MTLVVIIISCLLLLIAFIFEITAHKIKVPSVILMLLLGWLARQSADLMSLDLPDLNPVLPVFGTVGLILIVLEGSLELEITKEKKGLIKKSFFMALAPMILMAFALAGAFYYAGHGSFKDCLSNVIPLCVISSAIAIPSVNKLDKGKKEFVVFESSFSDILGVMLFNIIALNKEINIESFEMFIAQIVIILLISVFSTIGISYLMTRINYHIKYVPILLVIILVYALSKIVHMPGLVFVLLCGLFLGNIRQIPLTRKWKDRLRPDLIALNIHRFKEITVEFTFIIRVLFFVTFGFLIKTNEVLNPDTILWAMGIVAGAFILRIIFLRISRLPLVPLFTVAPRGLITILLFYLIPDESRIALVNKSLVVQIILLTVLCMMLGLLSAGSPKNKSQGLRTE